MAVHVFFLPAIRFFSKVEVIKPPELKFKKGGPAHFRQPFAVGPSYIERRHSGQLFYTDGYMTYMSSAGPYGDHLVP